jgi:hypothetical protein
VERTLRAAVGAAALPEENGDPFDKSAKHKDNQFTRSKLREKQPHYFKYLIGLFGFDPDGAPVASQASPTLVQNSSAAAKSGVE